MNIHSHPKLPFPIDPDFSRPLYPLSAVVGQEQMKTALLLLAIDHHLGGVLLIGEKGTAKSTAVRALTELLPAISVVAGCPYHCDPDQPMDLCPNCRLKLEAGGILPRTNIATPFLTLPLGATEDRVAGGLDLEKSMAGGRPILQPGLLGQANRGFLYIDEVNLLDPYLAHLLLDSVETGRLVVEREGVSTWHPAKVALIGTMNPEEGPLGPQLSDRFALVVNMVGEQDHTQRMEIIRRRLAFEADPPAFRQQWRQAGMSWRQRLEQARRILPSLQIPPIVKDYIAQLTSQSQTAGHRPDIALARAGRALAAWSGTHIVQEKDIRAVFDLVMAARSTPHKEKKMTVIKGQVEAPPATWQSEIPYVPSSAPEFQPIGAVGDEHADREPIFRLYQPLDGFEVVTPINRREVGPKSRSGRRTARTTDQGRGRYYRSSSARLGRPIAFDATIRAAAPHQPARRAENSRPVIIKNHDVREKVFRQKTGRLILFVVDASGSVGSYQRMSEAKAAAMSLLTDAYRKRDRVALISFNGTRARLLLPPTNSVEMAGRLLNDLPTGGKTPLAAALICAHRILRAEMAKDPHLTPLVVIMTDGRPNISLEPGVDPWRESLSMAADLGKDRRLRFLVVDTDHGHYADYKLTTDLARNLCAGKVSLEDIRAGRLERLLESMV
ncbi:MAG: ATP-binding protein [Deltaproteobacteria bacterium]|nr:ATP-binding protein [Deltaproteobacteria bacterium]